MKKRYLLSGIGAIGAGVAGVVLKDKNKREKLKLTIENTTTKIKNMNKEKETTLEDAGIPDQVEDKDQAQLENSKMVSEGSQFGVNYYNEVKNEEDKVTTK
ncbi:hypothetical protein CFK37_16375 [Virgibacillus phasianinus]|uniref:Uncharacterized protein n=1 Tax=Virgibacillus phasianinus TaxID=2017483 RepID=A0A220U6Z7_9BACI|nr:hypothetical protein [Virgibacillus phasianinus]ASK63621.1 hypothetical protein CFK37_16375 [Virgibacillus phasianinus]